MTAPVCLFDLDHTLLDSDESERRAYLRTMSDAGLHDPGRHFETYRAINGRLWAAVERHEISPNEVKVRRFAEFNAATGLDADPTAMADDFVDGLASFGELYPGARELLDTLAARTTLALVTNGIGQVQRRRLERLDLASTFAAVAISGELGVSKPDPAIFDHVFAELTSALGHSVGSADAVMIGDSLTSDMAGAANAGIRSIWFNRHAAPAPTDPTVDHVVHQLGEIAELV